MTGLTVTLTRTCPFCSSGPSFSVPVGAITKLRSRSNLLETCWQRILLTSRVGCSAEATRGRPHLGLLPMSKCWALLSDLQTRGVHCRLSRPLPWPFLSTSWGHHCLRHRETCVLALPFFEWQDQKTCEPCFYFHFMDEKTEMALIEQAIPRRAVERRL